MPYTASELPIMATTPNLVYGTYGPQTLLDTQSLESIPKPVYISNDLEARLSVPEAKKLPLSGRVVSYDPILKLQPKEVNEPLEVGLEDIKAISGQYIDECHEAGYVCDATVTLSDDKLNIAVSPLVLESIEVTGEGEKQQKALRWLLRWIPTNEPMKLHHVKRQLRLIQSNPDLPLAAELQAIPYTHHAKLVVKLTEKKNPNHVVLSWNNLDQPIFGRHFGAITAVNNNVTGHGDSLMLSAVQGYRSTGGFSRYEYPVTPALRPFLEASIATIAPFDADYTADEAHTRGWAGRVTAGIKYVLYDAPTRRLSADLALDFKQAYSYGHDGHVDLEREAVRTIRGGINYDQKWKTAALSTRHEFAGAVPVFSGSLSEDPRLSWFKGGSQYFRYTGFATVIKQLPLESTLTLNTQWQFSPDGISNFDVGGLGGTFYGRGYREVYLFVDNYTITSLQWQVPAKFIPKGLRLPFADKDLRDTTSLLTFIDYGYGWISSPPAGIDPNDQILSTGIGFRSQLTKRVAGRLDIGFPILREPPFNQKPRLHFGLDVAVF